MLVSFCQLMEMVISALMKLDTKDITLVLKSRLRDLTLVLFTSKLISLIDVHSRLLLIPKQNTYLSR